MTTSFAQGTLIETIGLQTYSAYLNPDWCIGTVPHGGYVTSIFICVAKRHFDTVRASYNQPHTIAAQLTFLRRSSLGPAKFTIVEAKLGGRTSTLHIALTQGEDSPSVVGYFTQSNINTESGVSLPFRYALHPNPPPLTTTQALREGTDPQWLLYRNPFNNFRKAGQHLLHYLPRNGQVGQGLIDQWMTMANGEKFTQESLGYVVDSFPQLIETAGTSGDLGKEMQRLGMSGSNREIMSLEKAGRSGSETASESLARSQWAQFWYPTVSLNIDIKKALPPEGVDWLFSRVRARQIHNGRMDIELLIFDESGEIVALSNHVALIVPASRNMSRGKPREKDDHTSKL